MTIKAKMVVESVTPNKQGGSVVRLECRYDDTIPEDQRFFDATPTGHVEMLVNNQKAIDRFQVGKAFYVEFSPTPE